MKEHSTAAYLLSPTHPVTVSVIGCGGNGSHMLSSLARMHVALQSLGHPGLMVTAYDDDVVTFTNVGRQQFSHAEEGLPKSVSLISRINRFHSLNWNASPERFPMGLKHLDLKYSWEKMTNIVITCVDRVDVRVSLHNLFFSNKIYSKYNEWQHPYYWLDLGNDANTGQVFLSTVHNRINKKNPKPFMPLQSLFLRYPELKKKKDNPAEPSCSMAEALRKQDLYINSTLAQIAGNLLWKMFREGKIIHQGAFVNLENLSMNPIPII